MTASQNRSWLLKNLSDGKPVPAEAESQEGNSSERQLSLPNRARRVAPEPFSRLSARQAAFNRRNDTVPNITLGPSLLAFLASRDCGSDTCGKQELDVALITAATLFADVVAQSVTIGDFEAAHDRGLIEPAAITPIGAVITGDHPGRSSDEEITVYDSSGMALQDLAIGALALQEARRLGLVLPADLG